ncbi:cytochrome ubiquinol oxidase subunit I [Alteromonas pelagimontana]|uniref:Cytochrome ubiquinol oxidase subunit I n=1 Tax=Alteromonas pelagimontana TaxID=1858656 RepID=A0A6M4MH45_9ALTE|nr:cbb3-type cytochrome c oxidase subunit I [Alteromonas pelagimontana]QJR82362.1 cytochrome ubiquinol oxidase subunit I [Alteromonas pelagimontana]
MSTWSLTGRLSPDVVTLFDVFKDPSINNAVVSGAASTEVIGILVAVALLTRYRLWKPLWEKWLTSVDHKKIGIMYIVLGLVMMSRGVIEGAVMRAHQTTSLGGNGILSAHHFAELFSTHGTIMIFFVAMPFIIGLINYLVPLQIGARDMAFPLMNQISLGLTTAGAALVMISLVIGEFETGGWTAYPSFTAKAFSPGVGPDYWIWAIAISGVGTLLSGINFAVTIYKLRAPGMRLLYMPLFTWTTLCTSILIIFSMPALTVAVLMLALDRYLDFHFFTNDLGGNMMNYANLFWMFGHPEVYVLILPAYGVFSETSATFAGKRLYGYKSLVVATMCIAVLSFTVWLHHFFTMGQSATVNAAFGVATMLIAIPTGVKVYNWLATLFRGRIRLTVPIIYLTSFFILFVIGGLSGIVLANPTIDYQVHNSLFLVAHFHNVLLPGLLFGMLSGIHYWFPKAFGFRLDEKLGKITALLWAIGFSVTFLPLYGLGLMGMPRRSPSYYNAEFEPWMILTGFGALCLVSAMLMLFATFWVSIKNRHTLAVPHGDPWNGRTLEWWTPSPPDEWNFAHPPQISGIDAFAYAKESGAPYNVPSQYHEIVLPAPSSLGFIFMCLFTLLGFALTWWIYWLALLCGLAIPVVLIWHSFRAEKCQVISAATVRQKDSAWRNQTQSAPGIKRDLESTASNKGKASTEGAVSV